MTTDMAIRPAVERVTKHRLLLPPEPIFARMS